MYDRLIRLPEQHSFFLFGMRGTGKSTLINKYFANRKAIWINLLTAEDEMKYRAHPDVLKSELLAHLREHPSAAPWVIIDEVQKVPKLLDIAHDLIESHRVRFALTGSSARKLKRGHANLLAGRAFIFELFPLSHLELGKDFNLENYLTWGGLPALYGKDLDRGEDKQRYLKSYVHTYLKEEILVEQIVRNIEPFHAFLEVSAQMNGDILNFSKIARDANTNDKSAENYFSILVDTQLGFYLLPYHRSIRKQQISSAKYYYHDIGLVKSLRGDIGQKPRPGSYDYGKLFESFVISEIYKLNKYYEKGCKLYYLKTKDGVELDLAIEFPARKKQLCLEIKSGVINDFRGFSGQYELSQDFPQAEFMVLSQNSRPLSNGKFDILPWQTGIKRIFEIT